MTNAEKQWMAALRVELAKAVLPAVARELLRKDYADPTNMIVQTAWSLANGLAETEMKHREKEKEERDGDLT